jgi:hypothetical protein
MDAGYLPLSSIARAPWDTHSVKKCLAVKHLLPNTAISFLGICLRKMKIMFTEKLIHDWSWHLYM